MFATFFQEVKQTDVPVASERLNRVTISIGFAQLRTDDTPQSLIEHANNRLYAAKRQGRDHVICEKAEPRAPILKPHRLPR